MPKFILSASYEHTLARIEDHLFETTQNISSVEAFLDAHDKALLFISKNPKAAAFNSHTNTQSWIFGEGRYRLFFKLSEKSKDLIYLLHLIDNKEENSEIYSFNKIPTYNEE